MDFKEYIQEVTKTPVKRKTRRKKRKVSQVNKRTMNVDDAMEMLYPNDLMAISGDYEIMYQVKNKGFNKRSRQEMDMTVDEYKEFNKGLNDYVKEIRQKVKEVIKIWKDDETLSIQDAELLYRQKRKKAYVNPDARWGDIW